MSPPAVATKSGSVWEDLLEIFYAPRAVFERRRESPSFGLALAVFVVLIIGLFFAFKGAMTPIFEAESKRQMALAMKQNPQLTPEMMAQGAAIGQKFIIVGVALWALFTPLILGIVLWLAGKAVESKAQLGQAVMVAVYSYIPRVLENILGAVQALVLPESSLTGRYSVSLGVGRFLNPDSSNPLLLAVLGRVDVFTLWVTALMAIGLSVVGKIPLARAAVAAAIVWVVGALPQILGAIRQG